MPKISAVIISFNEEEYIGRCLESLEEIADEIIVVDSFSTDRTEEICRKYNVRFIKHEFEGYRDQKNYALSLASNRYVLSLDADEALSQKLRESVLGVREKWEFDGYSFNRLNNYCGQWIRHSAWYPDRQLRLFDTVKGKWGGLNLHEKIELVQGSKTFNLEGDLLHWIFSSYEDHVDKLNKYSTIGANELFKAGKKAGPLAATIHCIWGFFRSYILLGGFLDGYNGYVICSMSAYSSFIKYAKLRRLNKQGPLPVK
jgi:glycosyltransferase involved in cell wall biosynthesis